MFTPESRDRARERILQLAVEDSRVVAAALIGSFAQGRDDRWSDLDLTFALADGADRREVIDDWTTVLEAELGAVVLFDLPSGPSIYRVFLLPGCLQVDLSFTKASEFRPRGPAFRLLFGSAGDAADVLAASPAHLFGMAVHHAVRARICLERGRPWQAVYWMGEMRAEAMSLACLRRGLNPNHGRGLDDLPREVLDRFRPALVDALEERAALACLAALIEALLAEGRAVGELERTMSRLEPELRGLVAPGT